MKTSPDDVICETCGDNDSELIRCGPSRFSADVLRFDYRCRTCRDEWNVWP